MRLQKVDGDNYPEVWNLSCLRTLCHSYLDGLEIKFYLNLLSVLNWHRPSVKCSSLMLVLGLGFCGTL